MLGSRDKAYTYEALNKSGKEFIKVLANKLAEKDKVATGNLIKSLDYKVVIGTNEIILEILASDYLKYVDEGRRPGGKMPPLKALDKWVIARGIAPRSKDGRFQSRQQVKFAIAKSIAKNGIKPTNVIEETIDEVYNNMMELLEVASIKDINKFIDKILGI